MSLLLMDSMDGYTSAEIPNYWTDLSAGGPAIINTTQQQTGTGCMQPQADGVRRSMLGLQSAVLIGFAFKSTSPGSTVIIFQQKIPFTNNFIIQTTLEEQGDGTLAIRRGFGGPIVATTDPKYPIQVNVYSEIEWKTGFSHASQNEIRINGQTVFSGVLDCQAATTSGADYFILHGVGGGDISFFDNLYLLRTDDALNLVDFVGTPMVFALRPSSDGVSTAWLPSPAGPHYLNVTEIPCDLDVTRNISTGSLSLDIYNVGPALNANDVINAVQVVQAVRGDSGENAQTAVIVSGTPFAASSFGTGASYFPAHFQLFELDPTTSAAWTVARFNATQWGIQQA